MKKWVQGILISVIAGLLVWFLTKSLYPPWVGPKVELAHVDVPQRISVGEVFVVSFRATNQQDKAVPGCEGFVEIKPHKTDTDTEHDGGSAAGNGVSVSHMTPRPNLDRVDLAAQSDTSAITQTASLPQKPVIPEPVTVPRQPTLLTEERATCNTINPKFTLRGVTGTAEQLTVNCALRKSGVFRMVYGIQCEKDENSMWRLHHRGYIKVH